MVFMHHEVFPVPSPEDEPTIEIALRGAVVTIVFGTGDQLTSVPLSLPVARTLHRELDIVIQAAEAIENGRKKT